jgi:hypothetical protein
MSTLEPLAARLTDAAADLGRLRPRIEAGEPWPLAQMYGAEEEASWGPREVLAHVDEMIPFWLGEMERILEGAAAAREPVPFGRVAADATRIAIIGRDRTTPLRELFARLQSDSARLAARMRELSDSETGRRGLHPRLGELTVAAMLERFVVGHLEEHVHQLEGILAEAGR